MQATKDKFILCWQTVQESASSGLDFSRIIERAAVATGMDNDAAQNEKDAPSNTRPPRRGRASTTRARAATQSYRPIASHSATLPEDPRIRRADGRSNVIEGLLRKPRRARDPNRVEMCVPPSFLSVASFSHDAETRPADDPDRQFQSLIGPSPMSILGSGRVDPFASYPIQMSREEEWLLDQSKFSLSNVIYQR